jgi:hypothetical protein
MERFAHGERVVIQPTAGPQVAGVVVAADDKVVVLLYEGSKLPVPGVTTGAVVRIGAAEIASVERLGVVGVPATVVRRYEGTQAGTTRAFQEEAAKFSSLGYQPIAQQWVAGSWGGGAIILAVLLFIFVIGILILLYLLMVKPDKGVLTVTLQRTTTTLTPVQAPTEQTKACPRCAETVKAAALVCRYCGYEFEAAPSGGG